MGSPWNAVFDKFGIKMVSKTDKGKDAYVPNKKQQAAIAAAGILPSDKRPPNAFSIAILFDSQRSSIKATFYRSMRATDPSRRPEPRMGREFISSAWLSVGDRVVIGNIGSSLFAAKISASAYSEDEITANVLKNASQETIFARAKQASGKPNRRVVSRDDFVRNPFVVKAALIRSKGACETLGCKNILFPRDDGSPYMEVHHIVPLGEHGDDTLINVAALCPHCHRELHFGRSRMARRAALIAHIAKKLP